MKKFVKIGGIVSLVLLMVNIFFKWEMILLHASAPWIVNFILSNGLSLILSIAIAIALWIEHKTLTWVVLLISHGIGFFSGIYQLLAYRTFRISLHWMFWLTETIPVVLIIVSLVGLILIQQKRGVLTLILSKMLTICFALFLIGSILVTTDYPSYTMKMTFLSYAIYYGFSALIILVFALTYYDKTKQTIIQKSPSDISFD